MRRERQIDIETENDRQTERERQSDIFFRPFFW